MENQPKPVPAAPVEIWAGIESTVNRVGDRYFDQLIWNGHDRRIEDLDLFASLGITAIRYPILWERIAPGGLQAASWEWSDARLERLRALGLRPIAGLVHHGSGPPDTSLVDPAFPEKLAAYARAVAERYPWLDAYTPVNEILTTARFSGLYGFWYPHGRTPRDFMRALFHQVRGVQLAMREIRVVNPAAQLVATDDMGKIYSTPGLAYQAEFENERRWLAVDLLCGRVDRNHPLYGFLLWAGASQRELDEMQEWALAPDILGINYYVTSDRFLDERIEHYPPALHGGNERHAYVDTEAARVCADDVVGYGGVLREAWERYRLPLAATEVHLGGHREQQLRWLMETWHALHHLKTEGVDVRALTAWSLLGAFHWDTLVTSETGSYESGVFDVRSRQPRPTALAHAVRSLAQRGQYDHPVLDVPGWWRSPARLVRPPAPAGAPDASTARRIALAQQSTAAVTRGAARGGPRPLLITGAGGVLGQAFLRLCEARGVAYAALTREMLDIADPFLSVQALESVRPWAVINAAGYGHVDAAEFEPEQCWRDNVLGPAVLAEACARRGIQFLTFSTDLVFDGQASQPYLESAPPRPVNVFGSSKAEAEQRTLLALPDALVVRTSAFFSPWDAGSFPQQARAAAEQGAAMTAPHDTWFSPAYLPDLVHACLDLLIDGELGIWHLTNTGSVSWFDFARMVIATAGLSDRYLQPVSIKDLGLPAARPPYSVLDSERERLLPSLEDAVARFVRNTG